MLRQSGVYLLLRMHQTTAKFKKLHALQFTQNLDPKKSDLLDHISEAFNILNCKFGQGLHFCIAGDTNKLKLNSILNLSSNMVQIVKEPTRIDPITGIEAMLDPIIMTMS